MEALQNKLLNCDCFLPSKTRFVSDVCRKAILTGATDVIRNGQDRPHRIYNTDDDTACCKVKPGMDVTYQFPQTQVHTVHLVFSSDLDRTTLLGDSIVEKNRSTRSNYRLDHPLQRMPMTLCREFYLYGERNGIRQELLHVSDNHKRAYHLEINQVFDRLILVPISTWGCEEAHLISFDFT